MQLSNNYKIPKMGTTIPISGFVLYLKNKSSFTSLKNKKKTTKKILVLFLISLPGIKCR